MSEHQRAIVFKDKGEIMNEHQRNIVLQKS